MRQVRLTLRKRIGPDLVGYLADVGALTASQVIGGILSFSTAAVAASLLGPAEFGKAVLIMSLPRLLWSLSSVKSFTITTRYVAAAKAKDKKLELSALCRLSYTIDGFVSVVFLLLVGLCGWLLPTVTISLELTLAYALSYSFMGLVETSRAVLSAWERFRWIAGLRIFENAAKFGLTVLLLRAGAGLAGLVLVTATGHVFFGAAMFIAANRVLRRSGHPKWWRTPFRDARKQRRELALAFSWNYVAASLNGLLHYLPVLLLGHGGEPEEAGYFRLAVGFVSILSMLGASFTRVLYPKLSANWAVGGMRELDETVRKLCIKTGMGLTLYYAVMIPVAPVFIGAVFGTRFELAMPTAQILLMGNAASGLLFWTTPYYFARGKIALWTKLHALRVFCALAMGWLLYLHLGTTGMALSMALFNFLFLAALLAMRNLARHVASPIEQ